MGSLSPKKCGSGCSRKLFLTSTVGIVITERQCSRILPQNTIKRTAVVCAPENAIREQRSGPLSSVLHLFEENGQYERLENTKKYVDYTCATDIYLQPIQCRKIPNNPKKSLGLLLMNKTTFLKLAAPFNDLWPDGILIASSNTPSFGQGP